MKYVLLPCFGSPLQEVWLPKDAGLEALVIPILNSQELTHQAAEHARRSLGIEKPVIRMYSNQLIGGVAVYVLILWLKPGEAPKGLRKAPIDKALKHPEFGETVTALRAHLARITPHDA